MGSDLLDVGSEVAVVAEEFEDEVLEVGAEASAVNLLEVSVVLVLEQQVVEIFLLAGLLEGEDALDNDEQNDAN